MISPLCFKMKRLFVVLAISYTGFSFGQIIKKDSTDLTFTGTRINPYQLEYDSTGNFTLSGYIDVYGAHYTDDHGVSGFSKFPTSSPRNNQFGLNIAQLSAKYESRDFHGTTTLFYGDIPASAWSTDFNMIQEANLGFRVWKKLWLDAGLFRTHIGLESIQPRENMTMSFATTTYFEPYFMSGGKLTWVQSKKWSFQLNAFNGFNTFVETNQNKALGASVSYSPTEHFTTTFSTLACDESPDGFNRDQTRLYNNLIGIYKSNRLTIGYEYNYGMQTHSKLSDSTATAQMMSLLGAVKYRLTTKWAAYGRYEHFQDPEEILTGPIENSDHQLIGLQMDGLTVGFEYKPIPNGYFRLESRYLKAPENEKIFLYQNNAVSKRIEVLAGLGLWF